jgi:hypothetical protein
VFGIGDYKLSISGENGINIPLTQEERTAISTLSPELLRHFIVSYLTTDAAFTLKLNFKEEKITESVLTNVTTGILVTNSITNETDLPPVGYIQRDYYFEQLHVAGLVRVEPQKEPDGISSQCISYPLTPLGKRIKEKLLNAMTRDFYISTQKKDATDNNN